LRHEGKGLNVNRYLTAAACVAMAMSVANPGAALAQGSSVSCVNYATNYARGASQQGQMLGGAAKGSLLGLGLGAIGGAAGLGAAVGGTVGLIGGGFKREEKERQLYDAAYRDCMASSRR
jgi:hypothetical protein